MSSRISLCLVIFVASTFCFAKPKPVQKPLEGEFCTEPTITRGYSADQVKDQPDNTADLPSVVQTVEQALKCYQALTTTGSEAAQPKGLPKLSSAVFDFKTTTAKTVGFSISFFIFKVGASREKDATNDVSFTYSVPKNVSLPKGPGFAKPSATSFFDQLVKDLQAAANTAKMQSQALGMPLSKVQISISYGIKFDGSVSVNAPVQLVTIGGNGDYNKNNTQSLTLTFGE